MAVITPTTHCIAFQTRGKIGSPYEYGLKRQGKWKYGQNHPKWGIYQIRRPFGKMQHVKMIHYRPTNPQTIPQQANRQKYADSILAWQGLTDSEKNVYNNNAKGKRMSGFNLFIREYMLTI